MTSFGDPQHQESAILLRELSSNVALYHNIAAQKIIYLNLSAVHLCHLNFIACVFYFFVWLSNPCIL